MTIKTGYSFFFVCCSWLR